MLREFLSRWVRFFTAAAVFFSSSVLLQAETEREPAKVLVLLSYHIGMPWADDVLRGLQEELGEAELIVVQLDVKRFPNPARKANIAALVSGKAAMAQPRLIIAVDDFAYRFVTENRQILPPNVPIVFGGVNFWDGVRPAKVTGVVEAFDLASTVSLIGQLHPEARRLVVVNDRTETGDANRKTFDASVPRSTGKEIVWIGEGTFEETEAQLARLHPQRDAVLLMSWNRDSTGASRSYEHAAERAREVCPAPLYGIWNFYFGRGIVGGYLLSGRTHGHEIAELASRVLAGEDPDHIDVITRCRTQLLLDHRELARFDVPTSSIPDGATVDFQPYTFWTAHGKVIVAAGLIVTLQGITIAWLAVARNRRRQAEVRLRASEEHLRLTLDSIEEAVIVTNTSLAITRMNPAAERTTGWQLSDARGKPLSDVLALTDYQTKLPVSPPPRDALLGGKVPTETSRASLRTRDGNEIAVVHSAAAMRDGSGAVCGMVTVLRDVTAQQRLEEQLYQVQKMESIGQLAGGIAHDFNNILAIVVGHGELLREQLRDLPAAREDLEMMMRGAQRATDLVQQILTFSRKTKHEMAPTSLDSVVKEALKFLRSTVPSSIEISAHVSQQLPLVMADATQIHQVLMNLAANALHAMKGNAGRLELRLESLHADAEFARLHTGLREGEYVRLSVADTGHGMTETTLRHIFEPFFTTKSKNEGTGLGLCVVLGIVQSHRGGIFAYSRPGEGSIFHVYLPALSVGSAPEVCPIERPPHGHGERIVFVDDEPSICASARRVAEHLGYRIRTFTQPQAALEYLQSCPADVDVLITDLSMPGVTGLELCAKVHAVVPTLPVILTTGFAADLTEPSVSTLGVAKLVLKPFTSSEFARALNEVLSPKHSGFSTKPEIS